MRKGRGKRLKSDLDRRVVSGILLLLFMLPTVTSGADRKYLALEEGRVTLEVREERAGDLFAAFSEMAGFILVISPEVAGRKVSASFRKVPVEEAVMRLISLIDVKNYSLSYDDKGAVKEVRLLDGGESRLPLKDHGRKEVPSGPSALSGSGETVGEGADEMLEDEAPDQGPPYRTNLLPPRPRYIPLRR